MLFNSFLDFFQSYPLIISVLFIILWINIFNLKLILDNRIIHRHMTVSCCYYAVAFIGNSTYRRHISRRTSIYKKKALVSTIQPCRPVKCSLYYALCIMHIVKTVNLRYINLIRITYIRHILINQPVIALSPRHMHWNYIFFAVFPQMRYHIFILVIIFHLFHFLFILLLLSIVDIYII